jgi:hypothetical protein
MAGWRGRLDGAWVPVLSNDTNLFPAVTHRGVVILQDKSH